MTSSKAEQYMQNKQAKGNKRKKQLLVLEEWLLLTKMTDNESFPYKFLSKILKEFKNKNRTFSLIKNFKIFFTCYHILLSS